jgi:hypothetical protein
MNKIEEIKKELEKSLGYNFNNWGKGDLQMLKEIIEANDKVVKNLALCAVSHRRELLIAFKEHLDNRDEKGYFITEYVIDEFIESNL